MFRVFNCILILLIQSFFYSCKNKDSFINTFNNFPEVDSIHFSNLLTLDKSHSANNLFISDSSFIVVNKEKLIKNFLFYEYSIISKKVIGRYIRWGTKKDMIYGPMSTGLFSKNKLWVHDISLNKFLIADLRNKISFDTISNLEEYNINDFAYSTQLMSSDKLLESGIYTAPEYLSILDLKGDNPEKFIGEFVPPNKIFPINTWKAAYEGFLFLKPREDSAVLACRYSDRFVLFDIKSGNYKTLSGPLNFSPSFDQIKGIEYPVSRNDETRFAFLGGTVTNQFIYLLFSGLKEKDHNFNYGKLIFVYTWSGNPIRLLLLDRYVSSIAVSEDNNILYAIDPNSNAILKSELPN